MIQEPDPLPAATQEPPLPEEDALREAEDAPLTLVALAPPTRSLVESGEAANAYAAAHLFERQHQALAAETRRRQRSDLRVFRRYLEEAGSIVVGDLFTEPEAWRGVTWGLVAGFVEWQLQQGYALGTLTNRLSTVQLHAAWAAQAGVISPEALTLLKTVTGYHGKKGRNVDAGRAVQRVGRKKAQPVLLSRAEAVDLKTRHALDTGQGLRDRLLLCLLLDLGLRCEEVASLNVDALDLEQQLVRVYRRKVDLWQTLRLTDECVTAATEYLEAVQPQTALLMASRKDGTLITAWPLRTKAGTVELQPVRMTPRAVSARVATLGWVLLGKSGLSPHDCRHYWADSAAAGGTELNALREGGGWRSLEMPLRYQRKRAIANSGVKLAEEGQL